RTGSRSPTGCGECAGRTPRSGSRPACRRGKAAPVRKARPPAEGEPLLTPGQAAAELKVGVQTLTRWEAEGKSGAVRTIGGHRRYGAAEVARLKLRRGRAGAAGGQRGGPRWAGH